MTEWTRTDVLVYLILIFPLITFVPGYLIFKAVCWKYEMPQIDFYQKIFINFSISILLTSMVSVVLLTLSHFKLMSVVYADLIIALLCALLGKFKFVRHLPKTKGYLEISEIMVMLFLIVGVYLHYRPQEEIIGNTLAGSYANYGFYITQKGNWFFLDQIVNSDSFISDLSDSGYAYFNATKNGLLPSFDPLFSVWMGIFACLFGPGVMFYLNCFLSTVVALGAYSIGRGYLNRTAGLVFMAFLIFHVQSIATSHQNSPQWLAILFIMTGIYMLYLDHQRPHWIWPLLGGLSVFLLQLTYFPYGCFAIGAMIYFAILQLWNSQRSIIWLIGLFVFYSLALVFEYIFFKGYFTYVLKSWDLSLLEFLLDWMTFGVFLAILTWLCALKRVQNYIQNLLKNRSSVLFTLGSCFIIIVGIGMEILNYTQSPYRKPWMIISLVTWFVFSRYLLPWIGHVRLMFRFVAIGLCGVLFIIPIYAHQETIFRTRYIGQHDFCARVLEECKRAEIIICDEPSLSMPLLIFFDQPVLTLSKLSEEEYNKLVESLQSLIDQGKNIYYLTIQRKFFEGQFKLKTQCILSVSNLDRKEKLFSSLAIIYLDKE